MFKAIIPDYEEKNTPKTLPSILVKRHASAKAVSCLFKIKKGMIIGADTLVYCENKIIGKPKSRREAFKILSFLQGRWHTVYTGVAILNIRNSRIFKEKIFTEKTHIRLKVMDHQAIKKYLHR